MNPVGRTFLPLRQGNRAFTLVEVVLVLALLMLGGTILIAAADSILSGRRAGAPEDVVATVLQQARREAVLTGRQIVLRFDEKKQRFGWDDFEAAGFGPGRSAVAIEFLRPATTRAVLIGGRLVETDPVPALRFFPDGTCERVRVQIRPAEGEVRIMTIDPWTCAPGLEARI